MKKLGVALSAVCVFFALLFFLTGFYVIPKYELATSCDTCLSIENADIKSRTIWFFRAGSRLPFIASDGGLMMEMKEKGIPFFERINRTLESRNMAEGRVILNLPYFLVMYKFSAAGKTPVKYDDAF